MERFVKGDIVVVPFPFSDLSGTKRRPALVVMDLPGDDVILCQISSVFRNDAFTLPLNHSDFVSGSLPVASFIRLNKLFTADKNLILYARGHLSDTKTEEVINSLVSMLRSA